MKLKFGEWPELQRDIQSNPDHRNSANHQQYNSNREHYVDASKSKGEPLYTDPLFYLGGIGPEATAMK